MFRKYDVHTVLPLGHFYFREKLLISTKQNIVPKADMDKKEGEMNGKVMAAGSWDGGSGERQTVLLRRGQCSLPVTQRSRGWDSPKNLHDKQKVLKV